MYKNVTYLKIVVCISLHDFSFEFAIFVYKLQPLFCSLWHIPQPDTVSAVHMWLCIITSLAVMCFWKLSAVLLSFNMYESTETY